VSGGDAPERETGVITMIPTHVHGVIDYLVGIVMILAPYILGFAD
jgi:hypothetical protein